jgi:hypothetical protein
MTPSTSLSVVLELHRIPPQPLEVPPLLLTLLLPLVPPPLLTLLLQLVPPPLLTLLLPLVPLLLRTPLLQLVLLPVVLLAQELKARVLVPQLHLVQVQKVERARPAKVVVSSGRHPKLMLS